MRFVTIDFETFYSKDVGFSKLTTEQYIRHPEFHIIGVGIKVADEPATWHSFSTVKEYSDLLAPYMNDVIVAHNAIFDAGILAFTLGLKPRFICDTLSMAAPHHGATVGGSLKALAEYYGLGEKGTEVINALGKRLIDFQPYELEKYGEYCKNDCELTYKLLEKLLPITPEMELRLIDQTVRMFTEPRIVLDKPLLEAHLRDVCKRHQELLLSTPFSKDDLMSNPKFAGALVSLGVAPPKKISMRTGEETYAFSKSDKEFTDLLEHPDEAVQLLVAARLGVKSTIEASRTQAFIDMASRGPMPIPLSYSGAGTTMRWSGRDKVNLQNLPRKGALRRSLLAPPGYVIVSCDSSNIELRVNHTLAAGYDVIAALKEGRDLYCEFASLIFGRTITKKDEMERQLGKIAHLGLGYGMSAKKFKETVRIQSRGALSVSDEEAERVVKLWRTTYGHIPKAWKHADFLLQAIANESYASYGVSSSVGPLITTAADKLVTPPKHQIYYPNLRRQNNEWVYDSKKFKTVVPVKIYGGKVVENCLSEDTEVLTDKGWKPIICLHVNDLVWDGVEFVPHKGVKYMGVQEVINFGGVLITPEHKVLIDDKFIEARETTHGQATSSFSKSYRLPVGHARNCWLRWKRWAKELVGR